MAFEEKNKAIGIIENVLSGGCCQIKVLALKGDNDIEFLNLSEQRDMFPPRGYVFGASFMKKYPQYKQNDLVEVDYVENESESAGDIGKDFYIISQINTKRHYINSFHLKNIVITNGNIDLSKIEIDSNGFNGDFYVYSSTKIYGKLRLKDGKISPIKSKRLYAWNLSECKVLRYGEALFLLEEPKGDYFVYDCMTDDNLFEWFRGNLKKISSGYVNELDQKTQWRKEMPELLKESDSETYELDKNRFVRIKDKLESLSLSFDEINFFVDNSDNLKEAFCNSIENHKAELRLVYEKEIIAYEVENRDKKNQLCRTLDKLEKQIKESSIISGLRRDEIVEAESKLSDININKDRILSDFSVIKEVLGIGNHNIMPVNSLEYDSFVVEQIEKCSDTKIINTRDQYINRLKNKLSKHDLFPNYATNIVDQLSIYKSIFIKDIEVGIAIVEATGDTKYVIQNVEPDWLHFKDFWNNGLGSIWISAHENPDKIHFLLLEDINMSSPECYARPLLDVINGYRKIIPYGKTGYPENLKILATKASTENPEIGLKLNKHTFKNWGAVAYTGDIRRSAETVCENVDGYINMDMLKPHLPDEFSIEEIKDGIARKYDNLFDEE